MKQSKPNILLITCHDIGQHIGCYGVESVQTKNLDRLASKGVRFENFYSTSAVCSPGRGSLHTGRYPQSNGLMGLTHAPWWWKLNDSERHTAAILRDLGYDTYLIGFNHIDGDSQRLGYNHALSTKCNASETVKAAQELIESATVNDQPFFAKIGFSEVHRPFTHGTDTGNGVFVPPWLQNTDDIRDDLAAFQATIKYFDTRVGEILDTLESSDILNNTLVIMTSDHGIPYPGAKWTVRKAGIEVPLIVYKPGTVFTGGKVHHEIMSNVDVLPTLLDFLQADIPANIQGHSFMPFLRREINQPPRSEAFAQYTPDMKRDNISRSVITDRYHLIRYFDQGRTVDYPVDVHPQTFANHEQRCKTKGTRPFFQLFDIKNDPYELSDIGSQPEYASVLNKLSRSLLDWMKRTGDPLLEGPLKTPYYSKAILDLWSTEQTDRQVFSESAPSASSEKLSSCGHTNAATRSVDLRCENRTDPVGIDKVNPLLSWRIESNVPGEQQVAYQVLVASSLDELKKDTGDLWDSGKVESDQSIHLAYAGKPLISKTTYYWKVRTWSLGDKPGAWSEVSRWTMGLLKPKDWVAKWITAPAASPLPPGDAELTVKKASGQMTDGEAAPLVRREFDLAAVPDAALVTVHSPGYFELYINGEKVGSDVLSPAVSKLDQLSFFVTYDVAQYLHPGTNCIGLWLGKGWSRKIAVRAQLDAVVKGEAMTIGTDALWQAAPRSGYYHIGGWKWDNFGGERIKAAELIPGWSKPGLDTASWVGAVDAHPNVGPVRAQTCPLNRIGKQIPAAMVKELGAGKYEIDFGTALTGWLRLKIPPLKSGSIVRMTFADALPDESRSGKGYQDFNQVSEFVSAGKPGEQFQNKFNYAGFRYVVVEGLPSAPAKEDAVALLVESDLEDAGSFECSNERFNRIHRVNKWTQRSLNLGGYYVDCPHRERMGYGDGQVALEGFMTNFRADGYYRKILRDWRLLQKQNGDLPHSAPFGKGGGGPGWGGMASAIAWRHYLYYADKTILEENYKTIRRYVDFLDSLCEDGVMRKFGGKWDFIGDWVPPRRGMDTKNWPGPVAAEFFNSCYHIIQMELLVKIANVLGKAEDAKKYRKRLKTIRPLVHNAYFDKEENLYVIDEQAYYLMPLLAGVTPGPLRGTVLENLERNILEKNKGHLDTGMLGTYFMMEHLREIGRNDLVFTMFNQTTYPGWGYMLQMGATTIWEQWNGYWSRIHSCFTSPDNWFYQGVAGIQADPEAPGFKNIIIKPACVGDLTWAKAHHDSPYGRIFSHWRREGDRITIEVTIPPNSTATVYLPTQDAAGVKVNELNLMDADHVSWLGVKQGRAVVEMGSGSYTLTSPLLSSKAEHTEGDSPKDAPEE